MGTVERIISLIHKDVDGSDALEGNCTVVIDGEGCRLVGQPLHALLSDGVAKDLFEIWEAAKIAPLYFRVETTNPDTYGDGAPNNAHCTVVEVSR